MLTFVMEQLLSHIFLGSIRKYFFLFDFSSHCVVAWFLNLMVISFLTVFQVQSKLSMFRYSIQNTMSMFNSPLILFSILQNTMFMFR